MVDLADRQRRRPAVAPAPSCTPTPGRHTHPRRVPAPPAARPARDPTRRNVSGADPNIDGSRFGGGCGRVAGSGGQPRPDWVSFAVSRGRCGAAVREGQEPVPPGRSGGSRRGRTRRRRTAGASRRRSRRAAGDGLGGDVLGHEPRRPSASRSAVPPQRPARSASPDRRPGAGPDASSWSSTSTGVVPWNRCRRCLGSAGPTGRCGR